MLSKYTTIKHTPIFSPTSDGAAAVVLCSELFLRQHPHLKPHAVEILGSILGTDVPSAFNSNSCINMVSVSS